MSINKIEIRNRLRAIEFNGKIVPIDSENTDYQELLDSINTDGADAWDDTVTTYDDIPEELRTAAENKLFNQQLADYKIAKARLDEYELSKGRAEVRETETTDELVINEETGEKEYATREVVTVPAIEAVDATVQQETIDENGNVSMTTIENPLITKDEEERAAAQAVVDATPQNVKDAVDN